MQRWIEQADARQLRPLGWMMALICALDLLIAGVEALTADPAALRHAVAALGFGLISLAYLRISARKWTSLTLGLAGATLLLANAVYSLAIRLA